MLLKITFPFLLLYIFFSMYQYFNYFYALDEGSYYRGGSFKLTVESLSNFFLFFFKNNNTELHLCTISSKNWNKNKAAFERRCEGQLVTWGSCQVLEYIYCPLAFTSVVQPFFFSSSFFFIFLQWWKINLVFFFFAAFFLFLQW